MAARKIYSGEQKRELIKKYENGSVNFPGRQRLFCQHGVLKKV